MNIQQVTICGAGVLGAQIAFQTAFHDFDVVLYDTNPKVLAAIPDRFEKLRTTYHQEVNATPQQIEATIARIALVDELAVATQNADLIIEAITENTRIKKAFYSQLGTVAPAKSIFCTNSSTLLPSWFAKETGRPERFLALHFANQIWKHNTAEIMGHATTDPLIFETIVSFAKAIGMIALPIYKEQPGYILNSLLVPFLKSSLALYCNEVADPMTIDKTWMKASGAPMGPFGICDIVGISTIYNINKMAAEKGDAHAQKVATLLQEHFIDQGKLGMPTGQGFYSYPNPAYEEEDFLS